MIRLVPLVVMLAACAPLQTAQQRPTARPGAVPAQPVSDSARLIAAVEANGCQMTARNAAAIRQASGLSDNTILAVTQALVAQGQATVLTTGVFELKSDRCI